MAEVSVSSRLRDTRRLVLDEAARQRRHRKTLEALEADNFQPDPHADLKLSKLAPKFDETAFGPREPLQQPSSTTPGLAAACGPGSSRKARAAGGAGVLVRAGGRVRKNFAALLEEEHARLGCAATAYERAQVGPSLLPPRRFCAVCGLLGPHTCIMCGARFCSVVCNATHQDTRCLKWTG